MQKINALLVGGGGREYALAKKFKESPSCGNFYSLAGSDAMAIFCQDSGIPYKGRESFAAVSDFCQAHNINLVVIGPEQPVQDGLSDYLRESNFKVFAPSKAAGEIEFSKIFAKEVCVAAGVPGAKYQAFDNLKDLEESLQKLYRNNPQHECAVKYDGLAAGKGVFILKNLEALHLTLEFIKVNFVEDSKFLIEELLTGKELSFFALSDGKNVKKFGSARDHKRAYDGDRGENTGGMGTISYPSLASTELEDQIMDNIIKPVIVEFERRGAPYVGILFAGIMLTPSGPQVLEFNARFGDPETQVLCMRFEGDLLDTLYKTASGNLASTDFSMAKDAAICVVYAANGYPREYLKGEEIKNLPVIATDIYAIHHGTSIVDAQVYSNGGRVLSICACASSLEKARDKAYEAIKKIDWSGGFYRTDIGM